MTYLAVQVGAAGGSAHGGASPPAYSAGSGCPPGPKARASPGRLLRFLPLPPPSLRPVLSGSLHFVALRFLPLPPPSLRPVLSGSLHGPIQLPPRISPPSFTRVPPPLPSRSSPSLRPVPVGLSTSFSTPPPGSSPPPSARISSGWFLCLGCVFSFLPLPCVQFSPVWLRFPQLPPPLPPASFPLPPPSFRPVLSGSLHSRPLRLSRRLPAHRRSDSSPFSFRIPGSAAPLSGLRSVARGSRRSAPTPLQRSGKDNRAGVPT